MRDTPLQVSTNPSNGKVTTGIVRRRFNPDVKLDDGTPRFVPIKE